jgi:hypothetical protein
MTIFLTLAARLLTSFAPPSLTLTSFRVLGSCDAFVAPESVPVGPAPGFVAAPLPACDLPLDVVFLDCGWEAGGGWASPMGPCRPP